ncbi:TPA: site-specific DNA-methyltransferase [Pseudomonas aeruginosa]|nr:site-specific DNA-methyltransferase [Pseudomonas aeruginosa]
MTARQTGLSGTTDGKSAELRHRLSARTDGDTNFWAFSNLRSRSGNHALFQYPAMMVPELQGALLDDLIAVEGHISLVYDPFSGSGTVMLESLYRGINYYGTDINPMAILLCEVKSAPPTVEIATKAVSSVITQAEEVEALPFDFPNINKWFKPEIKFGLSRLRRSIIEISSQPTRKFLWVCLAETIRLVSNSRISTFKLHTYSQEDIERRESDAIKVFKLVCEQNLTRLKAHWARASNTGREPTVITLSSGSASEKWEAPQLADVLMTSPPYGDNKTTVPYGQHSYLPLRWIDPVDLHEGFDSSLLESTSKIDSLSLGGSLKHADQSRLELGTSSPSLERFIQKIEHAPPLRKKTLSFCRDYQESLIKISSRLKLGAFCFFTLGERKVGGKTFPLVDITKEFLTESGHEIVSTIERVLPASRKRMAAKNSEGSTMASEWILVTRSWGGL